MNSVFASHLLYPFSYSHRTHNTHTKVYSLDEALIFDPLDIDIDVTPMAVKKAVQVTSVCVRG
jgi:hypothetical protein